MAEITASMVKDLRAQTGVGMMDCKKALQEADGDMEAAVKLLRERGAAKAVKRAERAISEGRIQAIVDESERKGAMVEVNIETDFAARNEQFGAMVDNICQTALATCCGSLDDLLAAKPVEGDAASVKDLVSETLAVIGENMGVHRCVCMSVPEGESGLVHAYIHPPGKVGVLMRLKCSSDEVAQSDAVREMIHNICLHVAFSNPLSLDSSSIPEKVVAAERDLYKTQALQEGKPEKIVDKIVEGRLKAFYKESCLLDQAYVKEEKMSVAQVVGEAAKAAGGEIALAEFARFQLGQADAASDE